MTKSRATTGLEGVPVRAASGAELDDPAVTAGTVGEARGDVREQLVDDVLRAQFRDRLAARREVAAPAERDHLLGQRLDGLRFRLGRPDSTVLDQRTRKVRVQSPAVSRVPSELLAGARVTHQSSPRRLNP